MYNQEEPYIYDQAFLRVGYWYVKYPDGYCSKLMPKSIAKEYRDIFGGSIHKHSQAPKWWKFWSK